MSVCRNFGYFDVVLEEIERYVFTIENIASYLGGLNVTGAENQDSDEISRITLTIVAKLYLNDNRAATFRITEQIVKETFNKIYFEEFVELINFKPIAQSIADRYTAEMSCSINQIDA